jgi:hypothetical protein
MIKIEKTDIHGWEAAIRGARNSFNSWDKSDSEYLSCFEANAENRTRHTVCKDSWKIQSGVYHVGDADLALMKKLAKAGPSHAKYRRFITVTMDVTGPLYWWKEMDTYKVGTVGNSCSTMHKIADKEFELEDFSHEHLNKYSMQGLEYTVEDLNYWRNIYLEGGTSPIGNVHTEIKTYEPKDKEVWWQMIQLLPSSYNQKRTLLVNYEVLANIYHQRKGHKLDEWQTFCEWIKGLPMSEIITGEETDIDSETVEKLVDCGNVYPISSEECRDLMKGDSND